MKAPSTPAASTAPADWDDLRILLAVIRKGSFLGAAAELRLAISTVSRRIGQLERRVGAALVERRADGAHVTPAGHSLAVLAERVELDISATLREATPSAKALKGIVRLSVGDGFTSLLMDCVATFSSHHPQVDFEFVVESRVADLRRREADIAFRTAHKQEPSLIYRRVGQLDYALWASHAYINRADVPVTREDLADHHFIIFAAPLDRHPTVTWLRKLGATRFIVRTTSFRSQIAAVRSGLGIGALPRRAAQGLVEVLPGVAPSPLPLYLVSHPQALRRKEVRAFADAVVAHVAAQFA